MKKLLAVLFLYISLLGFAQEMPYSMGSAPKSKSENFSTKEVEKMAILKECKFIDENNRIEQDICLKDVLTKKILDRLPEFNNIADSVQLSVAEIKLQFIMDKDGNVKKIKSMSGGNAYLGRFVEKVFEEFKETIEFEPAKKEGSNVNIFVHLPIRYSRKGE